MHLAATRTLCKSQRQLINSVLLVSNNLTQLAQLARVFFTQLAQLARMISLQLFNCGPEILNYTSLIFNHVLKRALVARFKFYTHDRMCVLGNSHSVRYESTAREAGLGHVRTYLHHTCLQKTFSG